MSKSDKFDLHKFNRGYMNRFKKIIVRYELIVNYIITSDVELFGLISYLFKSFNLKMSQLSINESKEFDFIPVSLLPTNMNTEYLYSLAWISVILFDCRF